MAALHAPKWVTTPKRERKRRPRGVQDANPALLPEPRSPLSIDGHVLRKVWVAYEETVQARWALQFGAELSARSGAQLTVAHVAAPTDEPLDERHALMLELLDLHTDERRRRRLEQLAAAAAPRVKTDVRLSAGQPVQEMLRLLRLERPDIVVAGTNRSQGWAERTFNPGLGRALLRRSPCPVLLVHEHPPKRREPAVLICRTRTRMELTPAAVQDLVSNGLPQLVCCRAPTGRRDRAGVDALLGASRRYRPSLAVVARQRCPAARAALDLSRAEAILEAAPSPVLVVAPARPWTSAPGPIVLRGYPPTRMAPHFQEPSARRFGSRPSRPTLLWRIFAANALVLLVATLLLIFTPFSISRSPVLAEVVSVAIGLAGMLAIHLFLLRRTLAPLRLLTDMMGAIDPHRPGQRVPEPPPTAKEVTALTHAFNGVLDRLEDERRHSARRALTAQEDERLRIAREMHDQLGQTLTALTIQAERAADISEPADSGLFRQIAHTALQSLDDARRIGRELRPEALDDLGLRNALITLCRRMATQSGLPITPGLEAGLPALRPEIELVIYRIAQEAVTNAVRHAQAATISVMLSRSDDAVELAVKDDGRGLPAMLPEDTAGISGMRERALLVDGSLTIESDPREGTNVRLSIPLADAVAP